MFAKLVNDLTMLFKLKGGKTKQSLEQVAEPLDPTTQTMETMKDDRMVRFADDIKIITDSEKCTCGIHKSDDEMEKEMIYSNVVEVGEAAEVGEAKEEEKPYDVSDIV